MRDLIKALSVIFLGLLFSVTPWAQADPTPQIIQIARKKANAGGAPPSFTYYSTSFNGSSYVNRTTGLTGAANGKEGLISFWAKSAIGANSTNYFFNGTSDRIQVRKEATADRLTFKLESTLTTLYLATCADNTFPDDGNWHHYLIGWNTASGSEDIYIYLDGSDITPGSPSTALVTDGLVNWEASDWSVGASVGGSLLFNGLVSEFYATDEYISEAAALAAFRDGGAPKDLGSDGSTPTGTQPLIYLKNPYDSFETNAGSAGNFTENGTLADGGSDKP